MTDTAWTLKPAYGDPQLIEEHDEDDQPLPESIYWSLSWGFALNVGYLGGDTENLAFDAQFSDADKAFGMMRRQVTPAQLREFARLLVNVAAAHERREATNG